MALTNYGELKTAVADWLNRADLTSQIPDFITMAEVHFNREVRHWRMVKRATASLDSQFLSLPTDWLEGKNIQLSTDPLTPLRFASIQQLDEFRAQNSSAGKPCWFGIHGSTLEFVPIPDSTYTVEISYYARLTAMSDDTDTNWLLTWFPDAYVYGALMAAAPYLQDDDRLPVWAQLLERTLASIQRDADFAQTSGATPLARTRRAFG